MRNTSMAFTLVLLMGPQLFGQSSLLVGSWNVNIEKSKYSPFPAPTSEVLRWQSVDGGLKFTTDRMSAEGERFQSETMYLFALKSDGSDAAVQGATTPTTRVLKRIDDHNYEDRDKIDGKTTMTRQIIIFPDGKTLAVTMSRINPQGRPLPIVLLAERQ